MYASKQLAWRPIPRSSCKLADIYMLTRSWLLEIDSCEQAFIALGYLEVVGADRRTCGCDQLA